MSYGYWWLTLNTLGVNLTRSMNIFRTWWVSGYFFVWVGILILLEFHVFGKFVKRTSIKKPPKGGINLCKQGGISTRWCLNAKVISISFFPLRPSSQTPSRFSSLYLHCLELLTKDIFLLKLLSHINLLHFFCTTVSFGKHKCYESNSAFSFNLNILRTRQSRKPIWFTALISMRASDPCIFSETLKMLKVSILLFIRKMFTSTS